jgi:hypothetical protein
MSNPNPNEKDIKYFQESVDHILFSLNPIKLSKMQHSHVLIEALKTVLIQDMQCAVKKGLEPIQAFDAQSKLLLGGVEDIKTHLLNTYKQLCH